MKVHYSSNSCEWKTPDDIIRRATRVLGAIDLDPCSDRERSVPAKRHFTADDDGLCREWRGRIYMNPPYGRGIGDWVEKLFMEVDSGRTQEAIALLPSRTDTRWFARLRPYLHCFVRGRLKFGESRKDAPFPSAILYVGDHEIEFVKRFSDIGDIFRLVSDEDA